MFSNLNGTNNRRTNLYMKKLHEALLLNLVNIINKILGLITIGVFDRFIFVKLNCMDLEILILKSENLTSAFLVKYSFIIVFGLILLLCL